ncbi:amylo-alpha-1,6-glucosidase [Methanolobus sediminis]|uniref:Amylo-alpha-1,6-glucosidase n=1 Tax=Methanolobus sediminis TaxID=3072978 RepID=A0AA51ULA1_9EURY|nr:amylo-alpha-1,6-glucosidase [Methanolobus sediminis]WMW25470.1 amylo-alpha-1,6-glucosidase [Methanolobus sediminis]
MIYSDYHEGTSKEWLITNGLGGYASSTVIGTNTRKYHGLLVASMNPPVERMVLLSSLDEELYTEDGVHKLAVHKYPGAVYPNGNEYLKSFSAEPLPKFLYNSGGLIIKKHILMVNGENTTIIKYDIENPGKKKAFLKILPLVNSRSIHHLTKASDITFSQEIAENSILIKAAYQQFSLISDMLYQTDEHWYYDFEYEMELSRGYPYHEDNFNPGFFELEINNEHCSCFVIASAESNENWKNADLHAIDELILREEKRIRDIETSNDKDDVFLQKLLIAGDSFIVNRKSTGARSIIAGYHWFGDWGRDTMISLPGLTLVTGRFDDARSILSTFASSCKNGLIPNLFPENPADSPVYNTVDASLWFVHAAGKYLDYTDDLTFIEKLWPTIMDIVNNYRNGTDYGIRMDDDGLIEHAGQLTWMDAKIGNWEVTPRRGKACEINALWYNALVYAADMGEKLGKDVAGLRKTAEITAESFMEKFHNNERNCLYDCISGYGEDWKDASIRPNQVFAVSLTHTMLPHEIEKGIVDIINEELLTPYGLRTLSPADSRYIGYYKGNTEERDAAYHTGTVWPWLLGPYITAYARVYKDKAETKDKLRDLLKGIKRHLDTVCIGSISEIFDGDNPHEPGGCISQAWSVAEIMRCYVENIKK